MSEITFRPINRSTFHLSVVSLTHPCAREEPQMVITQKCNQGNQKAAPIAMETAFHSFGLLSIHGIFKASE